MQNAFGGMMVSFEARKYSTPNGLIKDEAGNILNEEVWHDPKIDTGEHHNVILDAGRTMMLCTLFGLTGSGYLNFMAIGASSTAAAHTDSRLVYELVGNATRVPLQNNLSTQMTSGTVVSLNTFNDNTFSPSYPYYTLAIVQATFSTALQGNGNLNQPIQEVGLASSGVLPSTPTSYGGGLVWDRYVFGSATVLDSSTTLVVSANIRI